MQYRFRRVAGKLIHMDNNGGRVDDYTKKVAAILRREYERQGLSYAALADMTGLGRATVERIINGKRPVTTFYLNLLCPIFGTTPGAVMNEADKASQ